MDKTMRNNENMKVVFKHQDGTIEKMDLTPELVRQINECCSIHLCGEHCKYAFANKCPKVTDHIKKEIDKYDFITEGFQVFKDNGEMDRFKVTGCNKYEKDMKNAHPTRAQQRHMHELANSLRTAYFDEKDLDAAYVRQYLEEQSGTLKNIYGRKVPEEVMIDKIANMPDGEEILKTVRHYKKIKEKRVLESGKRVSEKDQKYQEKIMTKLNESIRKLSKERLDEEKARRAKIATYKKFGDRMKMK